MDLVMIEDVEAHRRALYRAEREAFSEYQLFLETTPRSHNGTPPETYLTELKDLRARLKQAETARKLFDEANAVLAHH
jgi:hypothetical protein